MSVVGSISVFPKLTSIQMLCLKQKRTVFKQLYSLLDNACD